MASPFQADDKIREDNIINESQRDSGTPGNDVGKLVQLEGDGKLSKQFINPIIVGAEPSSTIQAASDAEVTESDFSFVKYKEIKVILFGTVTVSFDLRNDGGTASEGQIYVNDVATGTLQSTGGGYVTFTEDLDVAPKDLVQLYIRKSSGGGTAYARNFRLLYDPAYITTSTVIL